MNDHNAALKAREFVVTAGPLALPIPVEAYAHRIGAKISTETLGEAEDAWSVRLPNGEFRICVNCDHTPRRQRFSVCHEVAHVVLDIPADHSAPSWSYARRSPGEIACDVFAAELLLPYKLFKPRVDAADPGFAAIGQLADEFEASLISTGSRFATFSRQLCAFVLSENGRVRYCARSTALRAAGAWVAPGDPLPKDTLTARIRRGEVATEPEDADPNQWFKSWERNGSLYEDSRHLGRWDQTLTLLWFDDDDLPSPSCTVSRSEEHHGLRELDGILPWPGKSKRRR